MCNKSIAGKGNIFNFVLGLRTAMVAVLPDFSIVMYFMTARVKVGSRLSLSARIKVVGGGNMLDYSYLQRLLRGLATMLPSLLCYFLTSVSALAGNDGLIAGSEPPSVDVFVLSSNLQDDSLSVQERHDTASFSIYYRVAVSKIDRWYHGNAASLDSAAAGLRKVVRSRNLRIHKVVIFGAASPEGPKGLNAVLARDRAESVKTFLKGIEPRLTDDDFIVVSRGEDWEGATRIVESLESESGESTVSDIFKSNQNPEEKKSLMKRLDGGRAWRRLIDSYYPSLRRSDVHVLYGTVSPIDLIHGPVHQIEVPYSQTLAPMSFVPEPVEPEGQDRKFYTVALKTNLLYDLVTAVNFEVEFPIGKRFSVMVEDVCPWWKWGPNDKKYCFQVWSIGVEPRWWFRRNDRRDYLTGHFAGIYGFSGKYDLQWDKRPDYQGEFWSAGLTYGYAMPICKWMNMEFSISAGFLRADYRHYQPDPGYNHLYRDRYKVGTTSWFGPTKAKVSLVIPLGKDSHRSKK